MGLIHHARYDHVGHQRLVKGIRVTEYPCCSQPNKLWKLCHSKSLKYIEHNLDRVNTHLSHNHTAQRKCEFDNMGRAQVIVQGQWATCKGCVQHVNPCESSKGKRIKEKLEICGTPIMECSYVDVAAMSYLAS